MVLPGRWGRWLTSLLIFSGMFLLLGSAGVWTDILPDSARSSRSASFFFCVILAYIIPVFHFICERSQTALCALTPVLDLDVEQIALQERALIHKPRRWRLIVLSVGLLAGSAHNAVLWIANGDVPVSSNIGTWVVTVFATMAVWLVMTTVVFALVHNASLFARLSKRLKIDLLNTPALKPFATVAVISTLAMIGAQAAYPLMLMEGEISTITYLPGLVATAGPMLLMLFLPIWPVHRLLADQKRKTIDGLTQQIVNAPRMTDDQQAALAELNPLLAFRREIMQVPEWPFDIGLLARLLLYLILPPLTWVGAALIENLVDSVL
ncbi:MAG: hypothetical protein O6766_08200 [Gammaproteobacteria bacterium]|nr:hypothetical protein [Gammaproteobacteria bacterium]